MCKIQGIKDFPNVGGYFFFHRFLGDVALGILLEVKLAALPWSAFQRRFKGGFETIMGIGGNKVGDTNAAFPDILEYFALVDFGFR